MAAKNTMRAVLLEEAGPPSNLRIVDLPIPTPAQGQVLIRVKAFGLNRSEILTRRFGRAPIGPVQLPRILGIEAAGVVEAAPGNEAEFPRGAPVVTALGGMGIAFDGSYAEYTCVPREIVQRVRSDSAEMLGWDILGALPEMLQTAHGCLFRSLKLARGETLMIRGGTTSVGLAAAAIAKISGATVVATTRKTDERTASLLRDRGADYVLVDDDGSMRDKVIKLFPNGVDKVLELIGGSTLAESISCLAEQGICCFAGLVGGQVSVQEFNALALIPTERYLTAYGVRTFTATNFPLDSLIEQIVTGSLKVPMGKVFNMEQIVEAHQHMESNMSQGKIVVLTGM
nr:quinone oxidoreductase pig3 [Quercus suber]